MNVVKAKEAAEILNVHSCNVYYLKGMPAPLPYTKGVWRKSDILAFAKTRASAEIRHGRRTTLNMTAEQYPKAIAVIRATAIMNKTSLAKACETLVLQ